MTRVIFHISNNFLYVFLNRSTNYTLGVGENRISFLVVDISHTEPWVINTYTLVIHRLAITHGELPFDPTFPHQVCSLHQVR